MKPLAALLCILPFADYLSETVTAALFDAVDLIVRMI